MHKKILLLISLILISQSAWTIPHSFVIGYERCNTCHINRQGGGFLNEYGRSMSKELLSTWSYEGEEKLAYGALDLPKSFQVDLQSRFLQTYKKNSISESGKFFPMQLDAGVFAKITKFLSFTAKVGYEKKSIEDTETEFVPRSGFLTLNLNNTFLRVGEIQPFFGYQTNNHTRLIRDSLGLNPYSEMVGTDLLIDLDRVQMWVSHGFGTFSENKYEDAKITQGGVAISLGQHTMGVQAYFDELNNHNTFGVFTKNKFGKIGTVLEYNAGEFNNITGRHVLLFQAFYNLTKGLHPYVLTEGDYFAMKLRRARSAIGINFYPRPHWDLELEVRKLHEPVGNSQNELEGFAIIHYYL